MDKRFLFAVALAAIALIGMAAAAPSPNSSSGHAATTPGIASSSPPLQRGAASSIAAANTRVLVSAGSDISCKSNFTISVITDVVNVEPSLGMNLTPLAGQLQQASSQLQSYANGGNLTSYRNYLQSTYDPLLKRINLAISSNARMANLTRNESADIRGEYNSSKSVYANCNADAVRGYAEQRLAAYNDYMSIYQSETSDMGARGIATGEIGQVLQDAQGQIVAPYAQAVNGTGNVSQIKAAIAKYCLFNECASGTNFHVAANYDLAKERAIVARIAALTNGTANLSQADTYIGYASNGLAGVGSSAYSSGQEGAIFANISLAANSIKLVIASKSNKGAGNGS